MRRLAWLGSILLGACSGSFQVQPAAGSSTLVVSPAPAQPVAAPPPAVAVEMVPSGPACSDDPHCLTTSDVIACNLDWSCTVASTVSPPSPGSGGVGEFRTQQGMMLSTNRWFMTRPLAAGEVPALGDRVVYFVGRVDFSGAWTPPASRLDAQSGEWLTQRVAGLAHLTTGAVTVSSGDDVELADVRLVTADARKVAPSAPNLPAAETVPLVAPKAPPREPPPPAVRLKSNEAQRKLDQGIVFANALEYDKAAASFQAAYEIEPDPVLLFLLGQVKRLGGHCPEASSAYQSFLLTKPEEPLRTTATNGLAKCQGR